MKTSRDVPGRPETNGPGNGGNDAMEVDYGPLSGLVGSWKGDRGMDIDENELLGA